MSKLKYDDVYPKRWVQPATYIRFSSTVEDCKGTQYCMTSEDEVALKALNAKKPPGMQCTEDWFEEVFDFFERTAQEKQPFAAVDNPPALPYEEFENSFDETISDPAQKFAKDIYDYWKQQRLKRGNHSLMPMLKFETNLETDDSDPYVCFRRREVRQARKTRGRDAQVTEKLKKLRHELEQARELMYFVKQREYGRRDQLVNDRLIFEKRMEVKEIKRNLGIKGDDEDLINQRVRLTLPLTLISGAMLTMSVACSEAEAEARSKCHTTWRSWYGLQASALPCRWSSAGQRPHHPGGAAREAGGRNHSLDRDEQGEAPRVEQTLRGRDLASHNPASRRREPASFPCRHDRVFANASCVRIVRRGGRCQQAAPSPD